MKIFVINLDSALSRKNTMEKQFLNMPTHLKATFEIIFFKAINANKNEHLAYKHHHSKIANLMFRGKELTNGEMGCFASHYELWKQCVALNENIIVLEDDVMLLADFWDSILDVIHSEFVYVRLMYSKPQSHFYPLEHNMFISFENITGTQGYFLTPQAANIFIKHSQWWFCQVDDYMDMFYLHKIPIICIKPILKEMDVETTIKGRVSRPNLCFRIIREITRLYFQLRRLVFLLFFKQSLIMPSSAKNALKSIRCIHWGGGKCKKHYRLA